MQRIGFVMRLREAKEAEYRARHRQVWPELLDDLLSAGVLTYSIFQRDRDLFGYLEVEDFERFRARMAGSLANGRWQKEMTDLIDPLIEPATGFHTRLEEVFHLEP